MRLQSKFLSAIVPVVALALPMPGTLAYLQLRQGAANGTALKHAGRPAPPAPTRRRQPDPR